MGKIECLSNVYKSPTNIASVHLVMDCSNARAGKIVKKKSPQSNLMQPNFDPITNYHYSGIAVGVALVIPILIGNFTLYSSV